MNMHEWTFGQLKHEVRLQEINDLDKDELLSFRISGLPFRKAESLIASRSKRKGRLRGIVYPEYTNFGCYPILYVTRDGDMLCSKCAADQGQGTDRTDVIGMDINYEDNELYCAQCGEGIEAAIEAAHVDEKEEVTN